MSDLRPHDLLIKRVSRLTWIARLQLIWERYVPVLALALALTFAFLALTFVGFWQYLGDPSRFIGLIIALGLLIHAAWRAQKLDLPSLNEAKRRVEYDSGLNHRPFDTLTDRPALGEEDAVWQTHIGKARAAADTAERPIWRSVLAPKDPYFLRFILPILLLIGFAFGLGDNRERLRHAVSPKWQHGMSANNATFEAWIDPPAYTGRPPIYFKSTQFVEVPEGSTLVTRVNGLRTVPRLKLTQKNKSKYISGEKLGPRLYETRNVITKSGQANYRLGTSTQTWGLTVIPDRPPTLSIDETPTADKRDRLVLTYSMNDDYGIESLELVISRLDGIGAENTITVPISSRQRKAQQAVTSLDLTKHVWASKKVSGYLRAVDGYGHTALSELAYFIIPDKIFVEPLAKAIVENRQLVLAAQSTPYAQPKRLTRADVKNHPVFDQYQPRYRIDRASPQIQRAVTLLGIITDKPAGFYEDPALFMGLAHIKSQLQYADELSDIEDIPDELWKVALRAEFGILGTALEEMREAERALREAISRRASQREVSTLFDRYNGAVDNYLEELRRKALENPQDSTGQEGGEGGSGTNQDEIQELLKAIEEANRIGDVDSARRALSRLAELLENLEIQLSPGGGGGDGSPQEGEISEELQEALEDLAELLGEQRELQSETERSEREAQNQHDEQLRGEEQGSDSGSGSTDGQEENRQSAESLQQQQRALTERLAELQDELAILQDELGEGEAAGENEDPNNSTGGGNGDEEDENQNAQGGEQGDEQSAQGSGDTIEETLERALEAMRLSDEKLGNEALLESLPNMSSAIDALRDLGSQLAENANNQGEGGNGEQSAENESDDPFGREDGANGSLDTDTEADIENKNRQKRARELLEELRNRAAEEEREQAEKDYLDRLLKQF
ncbi:MAG: DUF4175 family protein [Maricaulaceae bacterium]